MPAVDILVVGTLETGTGKTQALDIVAGARLRIEIVEGRGGRQILVEDPAGNPVELFQPTRQEARLP